MLNDKIIHHLNEREITFEHNHEEDSHSYLFFLHLESGLVKGIILLDQNVGNVFIHLMCTNPIPENKLNTVSEFVTRINSDSCYGMLVLDYHERVMGYKCNFWFFENNSDFEMQLTRCLDLALDRLDFYMPGLLSIAFGDKKPTDVINRLEFEVDPKLN